MVCLDAHARFRTFWFDSGYCPVSNDRNGTRWCCSIGTKSAMVDERAGGFHWYGYGCYTLQISYTPLMKEILSPHKWYTNPYNTIAEFMKDKPGQTVAELPFDRSYQFLSALEAPEVYRVNPIRPFDPPRKNSTFYLWLYAVARGEKTDQVPNAEDIRRSGLQWVLFDPKRCEEVPVPSRPAALGAVLYRCLWYA